MKHSVPICCLSALLAVLLSCRGRTSATLPELADTVPMRYAENILVVRDSACYRVELKDPWHPGRTLHSYLLVSRRDSARFARRHSAGEATVVCVPLERCVVFNAAHASLLQMLGALDAVAGVADAQYMNVPELKQRAVADCGNGMSPDLERIVDLGTDAVLLSPFENNGGYGGLQQTGIPIVECAEYMETSPLGRAEWMRFYGLLFGRERQADSLFVLVEREYLALKAAASACDTLPEGRPSVITERLTGGTWYVAGGRSTVGRLIADAGGSYAWASDDHSGSLALSFEAVLDKAGDADLWLFNYTGREPLTCDGLLAEHHGYGQLAAFRRRNVFYVNSLRVPYFEEVSFRPDWLLRDYVAMLHPGLAQGPLRYFKPIEK